MSGTRAGKGSCVQCQGHCVNYWYMPSLHQQKSMQVQVSTVPSPSWDHAWAQSHHPSALGKMQRKVCLVNLTGRADGVQFKQLQTHIFAVMVDTAPGRRNAQFTWIKRGNAGVSKQVRASGFTHSTRAHVRCKPCDEQECLTWL